MTSRAATVTKSDKKNSSKSSTTVIPTVTKEIVPGKFNDYEWNLMLEDDDSQQLGRELVEEACTNAMDIIYKKYIEKQLEPYTLQWAKDSFMQIVEWAFLDRDNGEANLDDDEGWLQDEEPLPGTIDCWAQGAVPHQQIVRSPSPIIEEAEEQDGVMTNERIEENPVKEDVDDEEEIPQDNDNADDVAAAEDKAKVIPVKVETLAKNEVNKKSINKKTIKRNKGKLKASRPDEMSDSVNDMEKKIYGSTDKESGDTSPVSDSPDPLLMLLPASCLSSMKQQEGRPPGNRNVLYDTAGNVVGMSKINPNSLPTHRVRTNFKVIDPSVEAAQAQLDAMRTGKSLKTGLNVKVPKPPSPGKSRRKRGSTSSKKLSSIANLPPPLLESMDVAPGVVVKEGDRVKQGPKPNSKRLGITSHFLKATLHPVQLNASVPSMAVEELIGNQDPVIRPLSSNSEPIPPIMPQVQMAGH